MAFTNNLHLWDTNNTNIDVSSDTQFSSQISDGFSSGSQVRSATFNLMWKEMSLVTTSLINAIAPDTTVGAATDPGTLVTALQTALTASASNISGGAAGDLLYQSASDNTAKLAIGTNGKVLTSSGSAPQWSAQSSLTAGKATNLSGGASNKIPYQTGSNTTGFINAPASDGQVLTYTSGSIQWVTPTAVATVANISGGVKGDLLYQSGVNTTAKLNIGSGNYVLTSTGTVPKWTDPNTMGVKNLLNGAAGKIPYQTGSGTTDFTSVGNSGDILKSNGTSAPTWVNPNTLSVNYATSAGSATNAVNATNASHILGGDSQRIVYQIGTDQTGFITSPGINKCLVYTNNGYQWKDAPNATKATKATNIEGGSANSIPVQTGADTTGFINVSGTDVSLIYTDGQLQWGNAPKATAIAGGLQNQIPIQSAKGSTTFIPAPSGPNTLVLTYYFDSVLGKYVIGWKAP